MIKIIINFILFVVVVLSAGFIEGDRIFLGCCLGFLGNISFLIFNVLTYEE